jgi:hypothetical protein
MATEDVTLSCRIPAKLDRRVKAYAFKHGVNKSSAVVLLLNQGLENEDLSGAALQLALDGTVPKDTP